MQLVSRGPMENLGLLNKCSPKTELLMEFLNFAWGTRFSSLGQS